jgi:hypothetical protein
MNSGWLNSWNPPAAPFPQFKDKKRILVENQIPLKEHLEKNVVVTKRRSKRIKEQETSK